MTEGVFCGKWTAFVLFCSILRHTNRGFLWDITKKYGEILWECRIEKRKAEWYHVKANMFMDGTYFVMLRAEAAWSKSTKRKENTK